MTWVGTGRQSGETAGGTEERTIFDMKTIPVRIQVRLRGDRVAGYPGQGSGSGSGLGSGSRSGQCLGPGQVWGSGSWGQDRGSAVSGCVGGGRGSEVGVRGWVTGTYLCIMHVGSFRFPQMSTRFTSLGTQGKQPMLKSPQLQQLADVTSTHLRLPLNIFT